jgi:hypothetical protein
VKEEYRISLESAAAADSAGYRMASDFYASRAR